MELLQKLTLYDIFGYALPGCIAIGLFRYNVDWKTLMDRGFSTFLICVIWVMLGYLVGIIITEISDMIWPTDKKEENYLHKLCDDYGISLDNLVAALKKAHILEEQNNVSDFAELEQFDSQIYSDIQIDGKYNRVHNYASAELLYKNMILVCILSFITGIMYRIWPEIIGGIIGGFFFAKRYKKFYERKMGYVLCWFLNKYNNPDSQ